MPSDLPLSEASRIASFMELESWDDMDDLALLAQVETGLPVSAARALVRRIDPAESMVRVQDLIPKATYYRNKGQNLALNRDQSEKLFAVSKVFSETLRHYADNHELASAFLMRSHPLLGGRTPFAAARESTAGADLVIKVLDQAEAGVAI